MDTLQDFALVTIAEVSRHIHDLLHDEKGNGRVFFITLGILFERLQRWLESPCHEPNFDRHVWKLLRRLDQLVQVRKQCCQLTYLPLT